MDDKEKLSMIVTAYLLLIGSNGISSGELYARACEFDTPLQAHQNVLELMQELKLVEVSAQDWVELTEKGREIVVDEANLLSRRLAERN